MILTLELWIFLVAVVTATPVFSNAPTSIQNAPVIYGEPPGPRTSFVVTSNVCICLLSGLLGYRIRVFNGDSYKRITLTQVYVFILYFLSIGFVLAAAIVNNGLGLNTHGVCRITMRICIVFYAGSKVSMYLFLVERAHALRAPYMSRYHDLLWLFSTIGIVSSLGAVGIVAFVLPVYRMSEEDKRCRIGVKRYTGVPLLTCDIIINVYLTLVFVYLLSPLMRGAQLSGSRVMGRLALWIGNTCGRAERRAAVELQRSNQVMTKKVERLLWKTCIGSVLVIVPTAANLTSLSILQGNELAFVCLTICTFDVTWAAVVFHWLTMAGTDEREETSATPSARQSACTPRPRAAPPPPVRKKSSVLSTMDLEMMSIDADEDEEETASGGPSLNKSDASTAKNHSPGLRSEAHWRDSGHSTPVADTNMSNNAANSH